MEDNGMSGKLTRKEKDTDLVLGEGSDPKCGCFFARNLVVFKHHNLVGMFYRWIGCCNWNMKRKGACYRH